MATNRPAPGQGMYPTDYVLPPSTLVWWSTPVMRRVWPNHEAVNAALKALVLEKQASTPGIHKSNEGGGWHSKEEVLMWGGDAAMQLQRWIVMAFNDMTAATSGGPTYDGQIEINSWANVNRAGQYNTVHTHPGCVWSGVYYVEAGSPPTADKPKSGAIEFLDPRAGTEMIVTPGAPFGLSKTHQPQSGEMIVFPSWLKHLVHPYWGEAERISIAFNIRLRGRPAGNGPSPGG